MNFNTPNSSEENDVPIIPKLPPQPKPSHDGAIAQCGECGLRIMPVMGYCCPRSNCPCGFGGSHC